MGKSELLGSAAGLVVMVMICDSAGEGGGGKWECVKDEMLVGARTENAMAAVGSSQDGMR